MRQRESCSSAHALLSPVVHPRLEENGRAHVGCALRSRTSTPSCPVPVTNAFCFTKSLWRISQLPAEKQCVSPLGKIKTPVQFLKEKYYSSLPSPCWIRGTLPTISAKKNQTSYSNEQNLHQALLAGKSSASWRKQNFIYFKKSMHAHRVHKHLCQWVGVPVLKKDMSYHCQMNH